MPITSGCSADCSVAEGCGNGVVEDELGDLLTEYREETTPEAILAHDADQLEMLLQLKEHMDEGSPSAEDWTPFVLRRLRTDTARELAQRILDQDSASWWFDQDSDWWVRGGKG